MAIDLPTNTNYQVGSAVVTAYPFSMACWFYVANTTTNRVLMDLGSTTEDSNQQFFLTNGGLVGVDSRITGSGSTALTSSGYSATTWQHAAGVFASATDRRVFLDGGSKGTATASRAFSANINRTQIGRRLRNNVQGLPLTGRIAECAIWDIALSDADVYSLSRGYRPSLIQPKSLVLYAPLVRPVIDVAGGQTLTVVGGTPAVIEHTRRIA